MYKEYELLTLEEVFREYPESDAGLHNRFIDVDNLNTFLSYSADLSLQDRNKLGETFKDLFNMIKKKCWECYVCSSDEEDKMKFKHNFIAWLLDSIEKYNLESEAERLALEDLKNLNTGRISSTSSMNNIGTSQNSNDTKVKMNDTPVNVAVEGDTDDYESDKFLSSISKNTSSASGTNTNSSQSSNETEQSGNKLEDLVKLQKLYDDFISRWTKEFIKRFVIIY